MSELPRLYRYIGPKFIADRCKNTPAGCSIHSAQDVLRWISDTGQDVRDGQVIATFVVDECGQLRIADRRSEHVACAGGGLILSAGEMTFDVENSSVRVTAVSNQSTGYCPESESWPAVADALIHAGLDAPDGFTRAYEFRICSHCGNKNLIKDGVFTCAICGHSLPAKYNCQS